MAKTNKARPARLRKVSPKGICDFDTPLQLVTVMMDAMKAHQRLYEEANTLHGDVNVNTILMFESPDGKAQGALIDYDLPMPPHVNRIRPFYWRGPGL